MPIINRSKEWFWLLLNLVLTIAVILGLSGTYYFYRSSGSLVPSRTFTITAEGKTIVSPDIASFNFIVVNEGLDPEKITQESNEKINAAIDFVKNQGIESKDIKTASYNLAPRYEYDEKRKKTFISGYTLTQTVFIKVRDFIKIGKILGGLPELGINQIGSLNFDIENPDKYLNEARKQAFEKAYAKAVEMAKQNHVRIRKVITFSDSSGYPTPFPRFESLAVSPKIEPGSQEVTVSVSVTYEIW